MLGVREKVASGDFVRIVCVGDMQTAQPYGKPSWTDWLQRTLWEAGEVQTSWRRQVVNTAVDRATPKHVQTYYSRYIADFKPDLVVLSFGITPVFPQFSQKIFTAELDSLLDQLQRENVSTALWSPYPLLAGEKREETMTIGALYKQKAIERNLPFIDIYREFDGLELTRIFTSTVTVRNELFELEIGEPDGVSLNAIGQYIVARKMALDLFGLALPVVDSGAFVTPRMENLRKWG